MQKKNRPPLSGTDGLKTHLHSIKSAIVLLLRHADPVGLAGVLALVLIWLGRA